MVPSSALRPNRKKFLCHRTRWFIEVFLFSILKLNGSFLLPNSHTLYIIRCKNRFLYYSLLYVIFSKNSFSLLSVFGVCRSSEKRVQRYRFSQYPPNFSRVFLKKIRKFSFCLTKREAVTLLNIIGGGRKKAKTRCRCKAATYRTQHNKKENLRQ